MGKIGENVLSEHVLDIAELEARRRIAVSLFETAIQRIPEIRGGDSEIEDECPSVLRAVEYAEFDQIRSIKGNSEGDVGVNQLIKADSLLSVELCFSFLHYLGTSAVYRTFEESQPLNGVVDGSEVLELKNSMLDTRANLRARVYDATLHRFTDFRDAVKYRYIKHLAEQAVGFLVDPGQKEVLELITKNCLSGILAEQKVFSALYLSGFDVRFANNDEESEKIDIIADGVPLQVKGNALDQNEEARFVTKGRNVPKVVVCTNESFPRFTLQGKGTRDLGRLINQQATVYN